MRYIKLSFLIIFLLMIFIPLCTFNVTENDISEIDNKTLINFPFGANQNGTGDLTKDVETYVQERIGFRNDMILANQRIQDILFDEMVHPNYTYGQDGYVFGKFSENIKYGDYHESFVRFTASASQYCESRGIPFLFVLNPSKATVLSDKLPVGYEYDNTWKDQLLDRLIESGVWCLDNTPYLTALTESGESVFNVKWDAGHWNDLGAFYGVNNILNELSKIDSSFSPNHIEDYQIEYITQTSLPVSNYPIEEDVPSLNRVNPMQISTTNYEGEIRIHPSFRGNAYICNESNAEKSIPRVLVFQGSYMNGYGQKFLEDALYEYIYIHDYQNIINLDYYVNLFQPDVVIFEMAEYTCLNSYFDQTSMDNKILNPPISSLTDPVTLALSPSDLSVESGENFTVIRCISVPSTAKYVYLTIGDQVYDMLQEEDGYTLTIWNVDYNPERAISIIITE